MSKWTDPINRIIKIMLEYIIKRKLMKHRYCSDGKAVFIET